jgi:hypothetical protein
LQLQLQLQLLAMASTWRHKSSGTAGKGCPMAIIEQALLGRKQRYGALAIADIRLGSARAARP